MAVVAGPFPRRVECFGELDHHRERVVPLAEFASTLHAVDGEALGVGLGILWIEDRAVEQ
jgi:hypothetical protein